MASSDIISSLPVGLIEGILEKLPLEERVKTSVLSSNWRFLWTQVPSLLFDFDFYYFICKIKGKPISEYMRIISSVVLQYPPNARHVSLYIPGEGVDIDQDLVLGYNDVAFFCHLIKHFLYYGCVEGLRVEAERNWPTSRFIFSPSVMSFPIRLTHLELYGCQFFPPSSIVFPSLVSVKLESIDTSASVISRFLSSCPKLLKIELRYIDLPLEYLDIKAPELNYLHVDGIFKWLRLSSAENIETLSIAMCLNPYQVPGSWSGMNHDIPNLFHGMDKLEKIIVGCGLWKLMAPLTDKLKLPLYDRLKSINLVDIHFRDKEEVRCMWNVITSCTNITELSISFNNVGRCDIIIPDEMKDEVDCNDAFNHLVNVFFQSDFNKVEMKLIELLLRHSPALERLSLEVSDYNKDCQVVSKEIMNFCRTSPKAKVYLKQHRKSGPVISHFLSSCPKLQKIDLSRISIHKQYLDIKAPELNYLHVDGTFKWLRLSSAENIETLSIAMPENPYQVALSWSGMNHDIPNLFHGMDKLEKIILGSGLCKLMAPLTDKLKLPLYDRLKSINLVYIHLRDKEEVLWMWNVITSCTNITELSLSFNNVGRCDIIIPDEMKDEVDCNDAFNHLVNVFFQSDFSKVEMKLIELLLRHSPALERLSLEVGDYNKDCHVVSKEIMNFCRTSPKAKVYLKRHRKSGLYL